MKWNTIIHTGWRRALGLGLILFGLVSGGLYYAEMNTIGKAFEAQANVIAVPSIVPAEPAVASTSESLAEATDESKSGKIKLNSATQAELESLPQIGPAKAKAIIDYRTQHLFKTINELDNVKGIGPKTMEQLRPLIEL